ncbi:endonuclease/exonuclease/phosphatase family protein [Alphaproteobacteria bacterium]|nr:endonuclease/exonuclease/phosphatase family protein [Alphaproteobacteria bacterium]
MLTLKTGDISDLGVTFASDHPLYGQGEKIRLLQLNAWYQNEEIDSLVDWLEKNHQKVDIIFMQEVEPDLKVKLDRLKPLFPYAINKKKDPWFGRAFLSKIPIEDHQVPFFKHLPIHHYDSRAHYLKVDLKTKAGRELTLFGIHAPSPISSRDWEKRNKVLLEIGQIIHEMPRKNKVLLGDFNITPYAFHYKDLLEKSGLQQGLSQLDSFPSYLPSFLRVPLDHFLVSPDIFMIDRKSIGSLGSDHLPMITTIQIF